MNTIEEISRKIKNSKDLDFGTIFSESIELFKKTWLQGLITIILTGVLAIPLIFVVYIPLIFLGIVSPDSFDGAEPDGITIFIIIITVFLFVVVLVFANTLQIALLSAYFRIMKNKDLGLTKADDYLFFLKRKYLSKTVNLGLMMTGIYVAAFFLCLIPVFYVIIPLMYVIVIYALNPDMPNREILKGGFVLGNKKWFISFGLFLVSIITSTIVGFLMCLIGVYITQQFIYTPFYQVYKNVIGFDDNVDELDQIGVGNK